MSKLKILLTACLAVFLVLAGFVYVELKKIGIIPRADYDTVAPIIPEYSRPAMLLLNKTNGFIHVDAIPAANTMFSELAEKLGWDIYLTDNAASHNADDLNRFSLVIWNNVSGDVLTDDQRAAFRTWLENGGAWIGVHGSGGDPSYKWDWYVDQLIGAQFIGHTMNEQFRDADVLVAKRVLATAHLPNPWRISQEEWYAFDSNPRDKGYEILLTADESSYLEEGEGNGMLFKFRMEGEHPLAWRHPIGVGRAAYVSIGHTAATYSLPEYRQLVQKLMVWATTRP